MLLKNVRGVLKKRKVLFDKKREIYEDEDSKRRQEKRTGSYPSENDRN